ncbi:hypothetical protein NLG97_g10704 [Lecanicillium saksenae]|uniref:Uncharacterized protein n=1 Tax=Lecanicillium saksenae TaxID=468837 RepID=A0ACC1QCL4_9HYPO|nr:hypothetical protein NLG97_g10704 [Lecanicillium saksenae]
MPTATSFLGHALTNLGPLTTTFKPAPSCTALATQPEAGYIMDSKGDSALWRPFGPRACAFQDLEACLPNGKERQQFLESRGRFPLPYHSPAHQCPEGWAAATAATASAVSESVASAFPTSKDDQPFGGLDNILDNFVVTALAPTETLTICCPSGYGAYFGAFLYDIGCTSEVGGLYEHGVSDWCYDSSQSTSLAYETVQGSEGITFSPLWNSRTKVFSVNISYMLVHTVPNIVLINTGQAGVTSEATATAGVSTSTAASTGKSGDGDTKKNSGKMRGPDILLAVVLCSTAAVVTAAGW